MNEPRTEPQLYGVAACLTERSDSSAILWLRDLVHGTPPQCWVEFHAGPSAYFLIHCMDGSERKVMAWDGESPVPKDDKPETS